MKSVALTSDSIRKDIEIFERRCEAVIAQFEAAEGVGERTRLADEYRRALRQLESSQFLLSLLERRERVVAPAAGCD
jgi:hypothetical protein